jgi:hypothetical protein
MEQTMMDTEHAPTRRRVVLGRVVTVVAGLVVLLALAVPDDYRQLTPLAVLSIPVEALLAVLIVLALPGRARPAAAAAGGAVLGVLVILKTLDLGFGVALARPFDPIFDWPLLRAGSEFVAESYGKPAELAALAGAGLLTVAVPVLIALAAARLSRIVVTRRRTALRGVAVLGLAWIMLAGFGAHAVPGLPLAGWTTTDTAYTHAAAARAAITDQATFARLCAVDGYRDTPPDRLLTGLRGKDVIVAFVESYGRDAIEKPDFAPRIDALLDAGGQQLARAGYTARSGFLTSSTIGGGSWYAHATFQSGLWVDSQRRYRHFTTGDRFTLAAAFKQAGWRTAALMPANSSDWPEGAVYRYDNQYDTRTLGYHGPRFSFSSIPDQFTLAAFQRLQRQPGHPPVFAEIDLLSSHAPWQPAPHLVDWKTLGDGSGYPPTSGAADSPSATADRDISQVRTDYRHTIEYSLTSLISYLHSYGDPNTVLIMLGDHQPSPVITGTNPNRDVPISIIAHDPAVLDRITNWGWQNGINPSPQAPVWPMDAFRDKFLAAYNS